MRRAPPRVCSVGGFRLYGFIALGSVASLYWVLLLHCIRFCGYIAHGSGGSSRDWDPWVQGGLTTPPSVYVQRGGAELGHYPVHPVHHSRRTESDNHWVTPTPTHSLFFPPSFLSRSLHRAWHRSFIWCTKPKLRFPSVQCQYPGRRERLAKTDQVSSATNS